MANVTHINYADKNNGQIYCRKTKKVSVLDDNHLDNLCGSCPMYRGSVQGEGVECYWYDKRKGIQNPHVVLDPLQEQAQVVIADRTIDDEKLVVKK